MGSKPDKKIIIKSFINIPAVADSMNHDNILFQVKDDTVISYTKSVLSNIMIY